ncbi:uncharacterized protein N7483_008190 [Penicillium malachiteum]|uniref:uncharacterized protein n=1 Tax=Penicillium malachiteum TaxID=1324776 RepID=UPI002546F57F|nr:uncharacterized protein N7483_008190 [Penicillium malachiteum]KAJ5720256.1 hypothetical protein N7483_008190 [Penicillium malachiteum]
MSEIAEIVREIGRQQAENLFYRKCYAILKSLQDVISQAADDLVKVYESSLHREFNDLRHAHQIVEELRMYLDEIHDREKNALTALTEFYDIRS